MTDPLAAEIAKLNDINTDTPLKTVLWIINEQQRRLELAKEALKGLTEYVQEQAALHNLCWQVLADNQVLVQAVKALATLEGNE